MIFQVFYRYVSAFCKLLSVFCFCDGLPDNTEKEYSISFNLFGKLFVEMLVKGVDLDLVYDSDGVVNVA